MIARGGCVILGTTANDRDALGRDEETERRRDEVRGGASHFTASLRLLVSSSLMVSVALLFFCVQRTDAFTSPFVVFGDSLSDVGNVNNATFGISPGSPYYMG